MSPNQETGLTTLFTLDESLEARSAGPGRTAPEVLDVRGLQKKSRSHEDCAYQLSQTQHVRSQTHVGEGMEEPTETRLRVSSACLVRIMAAFSRYAGSLSGCPKRSGSGKYFVCGDLEGW